jgi:hypothetical protein
MTQKFTLKKHPGHFEIRCLPTVGEDLVVYQNAMLPDAEPREGERDFATLRDVQDLLNSQRFVLVESSNGGQAVINRDRIVNVSPTLLQHCSKCNALMIRHDNNHGWYCPVCDSGK